MDKSSANPMPSVRDRLAQQKQAGSERLSGTLPKSGLAFTYPGFIGHDAVVAAQKIAGKKRSVNSVLFAQVCLFEGEKLTVDEIGLLDYRDVNHLASKVLGADDGDDEDEEDGSGN